MKDVYFPSHDGKHTIHACIWQPETDVCGVVQIIHGMEEYAERYAPFAEFLTAKSFLVCADDHLGHGQSVSDKADLGYFTDERNTDIVIEDIHSLYTHAKKLAPDKPYFILGHSMGSFFCRKYISVYGKELDGAVIMGSGFKSKATLNFALFAVKFNALFFGWKHKSKLIKKLAFGSYNKKFKPARTDLDWLSVESGNVDKYIADEYCGFTFTNNGYYYLFSIIKQACSDKCIRAIPKNLPVYLVAGADDPVGDYSKGVKKLYKKLLQAGISDVSITLYDKARHEILNDFCKEKVQADLLEFFQAGIKND